MSEKIFIVHGIDEKLRKECFALVRSLGLEPIVLFRQKPVGESLIKKLEYYSKVVAAIILLTPDDVVICKTATEKSFGTRVKLRPRENVIFELGFFLARLGPDRIMCVCPKGASPLVSMQGIHLFEFEHSINEIQEQLSAQLAALGLEIPLANLIYE